MSRFMRMGSDGLGRVLRNAAAISGGCLSAALFLGVPGMVMSSGYDALWYPACFAGGLLLLLLFIAEPMRRRLASDAADFAALRFNSPPLTKLVLIFVLAVGALVALAELKGAGTTLSFLFPELPFWAGVALTGGVITLGVFWLGGKNLTFGRAFRYWLAMFAILGSVLLLTSAYGHYGRHLEASTPELGMDPSWLKPSYLSEESRGFFLTSSVARKRGNWIEEFRSRLNDLWASWRKHEIHSESLEDLLSAYLNLGRIGQRSFTIYRAKELSGAAIEYKQPQPLRPRPLRAHIERTLLTNGISVVHLGANAVAIFPSRAEAKYLSVFQPWRQSSNPSGRFRFDITPFKRLQTARPMRPLPIHLRVRLWVARLVGTDSSWSFGTGPPQNPLHVQNVFQALAWMNDWEIVCVEDWSGVQIPHPNASGYRRKMTPLLLRCLLEKGISLVRLERRRYLVAHTTQLPDYQPAITMLTRVAKFRKALPDIAPTDAAWLNPFGLLTTKSDKGALETANFTSSSSLVPLRAGLSPEERVTANLGVTNLSQALAMFADLTGRRLLPRTNSIVERIDELLRAQLRRWGLVKPAPVPESGVSYHRDGFFTAGQVKEALDALFQTNGVSLEPVGRKYFRAVKAPHVDSGPHTSLGQRREASQPRRMGPLALLSTYSLIIGLLSGAAVLPVILGFIYEPRFGNSAFRLQKRPPVTALPLGGGAPSSDRGQGPTALRSILWSIALLSGFSMLLPIVGVMGRNLMPELYALNGAKGTDSVVLELPRALNAAKRVFTASSNVGAFVPQSQIANRKSQMPLGSVLSGVTCAGAFTAFAGALMILFGAMARALGQLSRREASAVNGRHFRKCALIVGTATVLGATQVEEIEMSFLFGQALAFAGSAFFPMLLAGVWWRGLTVEGCMTGMLTGGLLGLLGIGLTGLSNLEWLGLDGFRTNHRVVRLLCEQPAILALPSATALMVIVSKRSRSSRPDDIQVKMQE